jgi:4-diphosphocytidyl-2-C-methyl-D-erythritol kinase
MRPPRRVRIEARAKLNLGLAVGPRRPDGFHELATIFQSVTLADTLVAERRARGFSLELCHENAAARGEISRATRDRVPHGQENLAVRAARLAAERIGASGGVHLHLTKRIPAQAGLAGGSADAAAAMTAVLALHGARLPMSERFDLAAQLGSDVPFALVGGTAFGTGRGDRLVRLRPPRPFRALIAIPAWRVPTAAAFRRLDRQRYALTPWKAKLRFANVARGMRLWPYNALRLGNSFEAALGARSVDFAGLGARLRKSGAREPRMTGSGSGVFGVLGPLVHARGVLDRFVGSETLYVVHSSRSGLKVSRHS